MSIYYQDDQVTLHHGDCIDVLATLPDVSVDAVVTDPPYGLEFMGREWDRYTPGDFQHWCEQWAAECLRILKPGGHIVAFGGTRTFHRLTAGIEDAGFEIRDVLSWLYGSGFPKSRNIGPETAGEWNGWGTALKPAWEPIVLARKPLAGTVAGNVLAYGTGALNIDACRVGDEVLPEQRAGQATLGTFERNDMVTPARVGRFPANVVMDDAAGAAIDDQTGVSRSRVGKPRGAAAGNGWGMTRTGAEYDDEGGASRFFYSAKADAAERPVVDGVAHPTVKPLSLMEWLIRLVTPPGGTVLEPFAGSGTTLEAAQYTGHPVIGIERGDEYLPLIVHRLERTDPRVKFPKPIEVHPDQMDLLTALGGIA